MSSTDAESTRRGSAQGVANESTPLVKRVTITQVVFGQTADAVVAPPSSEELRDGEFVDIPALEGQAGDMEFVAGGAAPRASRGSIFKENIEEHISKADPVFMQWLNSFSGVAMQVTLCATLILIQTESSVWNQLGRMYVPYEGYKTYNAAAVGVCISIASVILCILWAAAKGESRLLFNAGSMRKLAKYTGPGAGFQVTQWLNLMALGFLSADVAKVLDQGRLLVTALITWKAFGRNQSLAGWNSLVVVSFAAVSYASMSKLLAGLEKLRNGTSAQDTSKTDSYLIGLAIVLFSVIAQSGLCVLCEKVLKDDNSLPFYVQKFYMEVPGVVMGLFLTNIGNPMLYNILKDELQADKKILNMVGGAGKWGEYFDAPFQGWNWVVFVSFLLLMIKSWLSGLLVKQLNAVVKQLCSVFGVGMTYFAMKVHICKDEAGKTDNYFCPSNLAQVDFSMVVIDFCVLFSVLAYSLAGRDKQRKIALKKEIGEAREAAEAAQARV